VGAERTEWIKCKRSFAYFVDTYCQIYDATEGTWIPFKLWPGQLTVAKQLETELLNIILKARQLGMTWLCLCYALWRALFHPVFTGLVFSRRETEAIYLMGEMRLRGIYKRLPEWIRARRAVVDSTLIFQLSNGSVIYGFPTSAGDSYTASFAMVDEADLVPDLDFLMNAVKPTIDGGGRMVLLSRVDKSQPQSTFKRMFKAARQGINGWNPIFLPWFARPGRNKAWYELQRMDVLSRTGALDDLYQQYPATEEEALKAAELDKRFPPRWLNQCYQKREPLDDYEFGYWAPGLRIFCEPVYGRGYVVSADPAEGNPTSDDSAAHVLDEDSGEQCAVVQGKIEPSDFAELLHHLAEYYNSAAILPERNNHGHAVILSLIDTHDETVMAYFDDKPGWPTSLKSKAQMYTYTADALRDQTTIIHDETTYLQLASIGGPKLDAPEGEFDDLAVAYGLGCTAIQIGGVTAEIGGDPTQGHRG